MSKKTFVLNDESKTNSYGFRVANSGIDLERYRNNPVLLSDHWNTTSNVIGRLENIRIEGSQLMADAVFDDQDEDAKKIAGKVDRGFIKGCSMGIHFSHKFVEENPDETYELTKAELFEVSIVAVPSNANAVKLYSESGELLDEDQITLSLAELKHHKIEKTHKAMTKIVLAAATIGILGAYGLKDAESPSEVDNAVARLKAELDAEKNGHSLEKAAREKLESKIKAQEALQLNAMLDQAVMAGQILGNQKETFSALGYDSARNIIEGLPKKVTLRSQPAAASAGTPTEPKTIDEFEQLTNEAKLAFKNDNPEAYKALFA